ncbi:hypothetical protein [Halomarina rubra]|uniref:Uncharacterized protein n=1 Tax=Halomarina rubra TaxID=2071873 RepID=A0ABD6B278_9EURY|nr:hypothetical protein [Halomarina rubra]
MSDATGGLWITLAQEMDRRCRDRDRGRYAEWRAAAFDARRWARTKQRHETDDG